MKPNGMCAACGADVRWIRVAVNGQGQLRRAPIDPKADPSGRLYIDHYEDQQPIMFQVATAELVPTHVPLRYTLHDETCKGTT